MDLAQLDEGFDPNPQLTRNPGVHAQFYTQVCKDQVASLAEGRPIFKDRDFIRITIAGDRSTIIERPATGQDKARYSEKYAQYKANKEQVTIGFPLSEWPGITRSQVEELAYFKIRTVEELAAVSDGNGQKFPMFISLREKARNYLAQLEKNAPLEKIQAELESRDAKIALLEESLSELVAEAKARKAAEEDD